MIKLSLFGDNRVIIENYKYLKDISENRISIDSYLVNGLFLKIKQMNSYMLEIKGKISSIEIKRDDE